MTISNRTLRQWRKDALLVQRRTKEAGVGGNVSPDYVEILHKRLIKLTQLLMDQKLLEDGKGGN